MLDDADDFGTYKWITLGHSIAERYAIARRVWGSPNPVVLKNLSWWLKTWSRQVDEELQVLGLLPSIEKKEVEHADQAGHV